MGLREQSTVGCFPEFIFKLFAMLVGLRKQFISNFVFPKRAGHAGFNNDNYNNGNNTNQSHPCAQQGYVLA